jgi:hypothetical protein
MKALSLALGGLIAAAAMPAAAQQISPMADNRAAVACEPSDMAAAVACLERHLKAEVKADIAKAADPVALEPTEIYVGLWIRNNWGIWSGSPLFQYMLSKRVTQPEPQTNRMVQALWLRAKGCQFDPNDVGYVVAATNKARRGDNPCSVTVAEAQAAGRNPMGTTAAAANNRRGAAAANAAAAAAAAEDDAED